MDETDYFGVFRRRSSVRQIQPFNRIIPGRKVLSDSSEPTGWQFQLHILQEAAPIHVRDGIHD
ncbi:hypothetical protein [Fuerstiella marisgermanici]|uniref:hypothetical protein n=1 Tax=Fuerstiella marisgermanici TaxID=1891926 RepID=UPI00097CB382|nr:hypothetical protein [Fuerstiella marisgermanici]